MVYIICSRFNSWVAEAMGVKFCESPNRALNLGPYDYQADALAACCYLPPSNSYKKTLSVYQNQKQNISKFSTILKQFPSGNHG